MNKVLIGAGVTVVGVVAALAGRASKIGQVYKGSTIYMDDIDDGAKVMKEVYKDFGVRRSEKGIKRDIAKQQKHGRVKIVDIVKE